ncbi:CHAT domain-containing protein [Lentzea sp. NPDC058436]|uniref:CHAT domain-containing protein n=1 Tax=Lentzea sp. NPDC058436 TaxID=3346499 RepID=UPI003666EE9E
MPESSFNYLYSQALSLSYAGREDEALAAFRALADRYPDNFGPWQNLALLLDRRGAEEAYPAFAQFVRTAPDHEDPFVRFAVRRLQEAGHPVPDVKTTVRTPFPTEHLIVTSDDKRVMLTVENDTGRPANDVLEALRRFLDHEDWLSAYLSFEEHPELSSRMVKTLLEYKANQTGSMDGYRAQVNLTMLQRASEIGALAAFAEGDQSPVDEFRQLVRAKRTIEPVLRLANGLGIEEIPSFLDEHAWLSRDDATYVLLAREAESATDEHRQELAVFRTLLERHAAGTPVLEGPDLDYGPATALVDDLVTQSQVRPDEQLAAVARAGEEILAAPDDVPLTAAGRFAVAMVTVESLMRYGKAMRSVAALNRAALVLADASTPVSPTGNQDDWRPAVIAGNLAIATYEETGEMEVLDRAAASIAEALLRVRRFRSGEAPLMRVLANIHQLQAKVTRSVEHLRESVRLFEEAARTTDRTTEAWLVNQAGQISALLALAEQGEGDGLTSAEKHVQDLLYRFGSAPGTGARLWDLGGQVSSGSYDWSAAPKDLDVTIHRYRTAGERPDLGVSQVPHTANNLCRALIRRYRRTSDAGDLQEALLAGETAVRTLSPASPAAVLARRNLVQALMAAHALQPDETGQVERAVALVRDNLRFLSAGPDQTLDLLNLAELLMTGDGERWREGAAAFATALAEFDPADDPLIAIDLGEKLGDRLAGHGDWLRATEAYLVAEAGISVLVERTAAGRWREAMGSRPHDIVQKAAYSFGRSGAAEEAVVLLERHHARNLRRALQLESAELSAVAAAGRPDLAEAFRARASELVAMGSQIDAGSHTFSGQRVQRLQAQLREVTKLIQSVPGFARFGMEPDISDIYAAATDGPVVYWSAAGDGGMAFVVNGILRRTTCVELPFTEEALREHTFRYRTALAEYQASNIIADWSATIDTVGRWLWTAFAGPLGRALPAGGPVTVVVAGRLALLPITAAVDPETGQAAIELFDWRFVPSSTALAATSSAASRSHNSDALAIIDPQPVDAVPLRWARAEGAAVAARAGRVTALEGAEATLPAVVWAISQQSVLHFACHGMAAPQEPLNSYLLLADDEQLTIDNLVTNTRLSSVRLVVLSACDTAVAGEVVPQEVVAMPSALIQLGAAGVVAAQWPVADTTAAVLALRFYELWDGETEPADAFAATQRWLRTAPRSAVSALLRRRAPDLDDLPGLIAELPLSRIPFSSPVDWAAFSYSGS